MFQTAWNAPFYTGVAVSVDTRFDVSIGGHPYMIDWSADNHLTIASVPLARPQADTSNRPGEQTLNPDGLWRRAAESWHHGAGQEWYDRGDDADPYRFRDSLGVDPWTRNALTLLHATTRTLTSANTNLPLAVASGKAFIGDGATVRVTTDGVSWTALTGGGTGAVTSIASDGTTAYAAYATGIHKTTGGALASFAASATANILRYASGRLWGGVNAGLVSYDAAGTETVEFTHPTAAWRWDDIAGAGWVFAAGHAGDKSAVYKVRENDDGSGLTTPVVAGMLPDGEIARALCTYLGFLVLGTSRGVRVAQIDASGDLTIGAVIPVVGGVYCLEPQDKYVWFGWANHDTTHTGLGRLDLSVFTLPLTPAYAPDLMATAQGQVTGVVTLGDVRLFTVAGYGAVHEATTKVASGWVDQGRVTFGIPDRKTVLSIDVRHLPLPASSSVRPSLAVDDGDLVGLVASTGVGAVTTPYPVSTGQVRGSWFEPRVTLTGGASLSRVTLRADPQSERTTTVLATVFIRDSVLLDGQTEYSYHSCEEHTYLTTLRDSRQVINFQCGAHKWPVVIEDTQLTTDDNRTIDGCFFQGSLLLRMKVVA
jgi:hypothetical protein